MSRGSKKRTGKLSMRLSLIGGISSFVVLMVALAIMISQVTKYVPEDSGAVGRMWGGALLLALIGAATIGIVLYTQLSSLGTRITDVGLAVAKIGRRGAEVRVRDQGNDEVTSLGRAVQYLASDLAALMDQQGEDGGAPVTMDPAVRELRDKLVPDYLVEVPGYELDGVIEKGSRGGLEYYDSVVSEGLGVVFLVAGEGVGPVAVLAGKLARDELQRALEKGATPRKALAHTNRVMHKVLPRGACAKATLLQLEGDEVKLYQAGSRTPLWIAVAGEVQELSAEGLALGLDEGPVFEKGIRPEKVAMSPGMRLVLTNEAGQRSQEFLDLIAEHSPKHTAPFMNLVLGGLASEAEGGLREDVVLITAKRSG